MAGGVKLRLRAFICFPLNQSLFLNLKLRFALISWFSRSNWKYFRAMHFNETLDA
jgi:hypothetical protein